MVAASFFGLTIQAYDYDGEPWPTALGLPEPSVVRSWNVWSPGNGEIQYLGWGNIEGAQGSYNWTAFDAWIAECQAHNTPMLYTFGDIPSWAGGNSNPNLSAFQQFVTSIVEHANGAVKYWEGLNEFNVSSITPSTVVQMQEIIYNTVHTLDPGGLVLSPTVNSYGADSSYAQFLADGGGNYFDIAAFHGYGNSTGEGLITSVTDLQAVLAEYGLSKPIWDTEWGLWGQNLSTTAQEAFVSTGLILQADLGVQTEIWYSYDLGGNQTLYNSSTGKLTDAGIAYETTESWLNGATLGTYTDKNGVYTLPITLANGAQDELVWDAKGNASFSTSYGHYETVLGQTESIHHSITIGIVPVLLEH